MAAAKKKAKKPMISKLVLHGPKIYGSLMGEMVKNDIGQSLKSLSFVSVKMTNQTKLEGSIADLLRSLPRLEELYMPQNLAVAVGNLRMTVLGPLSAARSGSSTLLRVLDLGESGLNTMSFQRLRLPDLAQIGMLDIYTAAFRWRLFQCTK